MSHQLCRDYVRGKCTRDNCRFSHDASNAAQHHLKKKRQDRRPKNTETFEPLQKPVDMRIVLDLGREKLSTPLTTRDVLLVPNLFADFAPNELYEKLVNEIKTCGVSEEKLMKLWHGDTHLIADDHTSWKNNAPTFAMVIDRIRNFFGMTVNATRLNWYQDTSQWKPFHRDAAAIKPHLARTQNFTVAVSFGATRDAAFEDMKSDTVISIPQGDGYIYAFAEETNVLWKHGILQEKVVRQEGRISVIAWGWIDGQQSQK
jgi:hypothetical protein